MTRTAARIAPLIALSLVALAAAPAAVDDEGFVPLVEGTDDAQFELVGFGPETIVIDGDEVALSGSPNGYFATKKSYTNYILKFDWKYERPDDLKADADFGGNSGVLVHIKPPHKVWPQSVEVQLFHKEAGKIFAIFGSKFQGQDDPEARKRAIKPVGEWNSEEITCKDGSITCTLNGVQVATGTGADPTGGPIGFQSEGAPIRFRKLMLKPLD